MIIKEKAASPSSSEKSYSTAPEILPPLLPPSTPMSSILSSSQQVPSPLSASAPPPRVEPPAYRPAQPLPFELREQVTIYFEEGLCTPC